MSNPDTKDPEERRERLKVWAPVVALIVLGFGLAYAAVPPPPPQRLRIATGGEAGAYFAFGNRYRDLLAREGIELEVLSTKGSIDNLDRLARGEVDLAFVQGGVRREADLEGCEALASLYYEPLWVFHRADLPVPELGVLAGKRLAIGPVGSGIRPIALRLLAANGIAEDTALHSELTGKEAAAALREGKVDAAIFVTSPTAPLIKDLIAAPGVQLMSFRRHRAYQNLLPYLASVTLAEGMVDLARNIPDSDRVLLAPAATLVIKKGLHAALIPLLLHAAYEVHEGGGIFERPRTFPSADLVDLPLNDAARRYHKSGPPLLQRVLPAHLATLIDRMKIMLIPLITLLLPLMRIAPPVYRWRIRSKIFRWYRLLREIDLELLRAPNGKDTAPFLARLEALDRELEHIRVPLSYMDEFYSLRLHIHLVRELVAAHPARSLASASPANSSVP